MANIEKVITRKAFHYNDSSLNEFQLREILIEELNYSLDIYDSYVVDESDRDNLPLSDYLLLNSLDSEHAKLFFIVEYSINDDGERENIIHKIPYGYWIVQMVDGSWEVMETPVVKDFLETN